MQCGCEQSPGGTIRKVCGAHAELVIAERDRCANIVETRASAIAKAVEKFPPSASGIAEMAKIRQEALIDAARAIRNTKG